MVRCKYGVCILLSDQFRNGGEHPLRTAPTAPTRPAICLPSSCRAQRPRPWYAQHQVVLQCRLPVQKCFVHVNSSFAASCLPSLYTSTAASTVVCLLSHEASILHPRGADAQPPNLCWPSLCMLAAASITGHAKRLDVSALVNPRTASVRGRQRGGSQTLLLFQLSTCCKALCGAVEMSGRLAAP